jgi:hypothetical protein
VNRPTAHDAEASRAVVGTRAEKGEPMRSSDNGDNMTDKEWIRCSCCGEDMPDDAEHNVQSDRCPSLVADEETK